MLTLPGPLAILEVGLTHVLAVTYDDLDVPGIGVYRLEREAGAPARSPCDS